MNKKILIGSLVAVAILVLVSFTGVVGYQTTKSSTITRASPLFTVRSNRAIDVESKDLKCDYVGKGEDNFLSIPNRDGNIESLRKAIESIQKMDVKTFNKFIYFVIHKALRENKFNDVNDYESIIALYQFRDNPDLYNKEYNIQGNTWQETPTLCWFPGCFLYYIIMFYYTYLTFSTVCTLNPPFCTFNYQTYPCCPP